MQEPATINTPYVSKHFLFFIISTLHYVPDHNFKRTFIKNLLELLLNQRHFYSQIHHSHT